MHDTTTFFVQVGMKLLSILACKDRTLKILDKAKLHYLLNLEGIPTSLAIYNGDGGEMGNDILIGSSDGRLTLATLTPEDGHIRWSHDTEASAGVTCLDFYDLTGDGTKELLVGFDDGSVHVYALDLEDYQMIPPRLLFSQVDISYINQVLYE